MTLLVLDMNIQDALLLRKQCWIKIGIQNDAFFWVNTGNTFNDGVMDIRGILILTSKSIFKEKVVAVIHFITACCIGKHIDPLLSLKYTYIYLIRRKKEKV